MDMPNNFEYRGQIFFNVTDTNTQGESYLLNQQFSNIKLTTDYQLNDTINFHGLFIYNHFPTPIISRFYIEQAYFTLTKHAAWKTQIGKKWVPFGNYKNALIYKPLTKALGQTNDEMITFGYGDIYYANFTLFYPRSKIKSSSLPAYYNLNLGLKNKTYDVGASYIYSIADSQLLQYNKGFGGFVNKDISSQVPGIAAYVNLQYKNFNTYATIVSAIHAFHSYEMSYQNRGAKPKAISLQSVYSFQIKGISFQGIVFGDYTHEALALRLPEKRIGIGLNMFPHKYLDIQFQYFKDYLYAKNTQGAGLGNSVKGNGNMNNTFALQFVVNF